MPNTWVSSLQKIGEFPCGAAQGSSIVPAAAWVAAVVGVQSLAGELPNAKDTTKEKKKKKVRHYTESFETVLSITDEFHFMRLKEARQKGSLQGLTEGMHAMSDFY